MINIIIGIITILIGAILWRMGGSVWIPSWVRKTGIATLFTVYSLIAIGWGFPFIQVLIGLFILGLIWGITFGVLSFGYGINSIIGQIYSGISNTVLRDILIRGTYGLLISLVYLVPVIYLGTYWKVVLCLVPTILMPVIRISKVDQYNPHIEEVLMGTIYTLGFVLTWR